MEEKNAVISYKYNWGQNQLGHLTKTNTPFSTHQLSHGLQCYNRAIELSHQNYIKYMFYDEKQKTMFHQRYDDTLDNYINKLKLRKIKPEMPVLDYDKKTLQHRHYYVNPLYRLIVKTMLQFIVDQHVAMFSLTKFETKNIVFVRGVVKFFDVGFRPSSNVTRKEDFLCLFDIIKTIFHGTPPTAELNEFLTLMEKLDCKSDKCGLVLLHHLAVMSPRESLQFFISCHERVSFLTGHFQSCYNSALRKMIMCENWDERFDAEEPNERPIGKCFKNHRGSYLFATFNTAFDPSGSYVKQSLLRCCRNLTVHLKDEVPKSTLLREIDIERVIMYVFGLELLSFQKELGTNGCLAPFVRHN